ncbi:transferrin-like [Copidosoma floridanum]|uniref:transferrin-like n=1 Tax=Copidosoma floridanum TaxID=29053 RepID=UPI0006C966D1|nr:transferrin-like [Copidosoma floridanum]
MDWKCLVISVLFAFFVDAQEKLKLCVQEDVTETSCNALSRLDSPIKCERVVDSAECARKLAEGRADFGIFTADELLLAHNFYPTGINVVAELRNKEKIDKSFEFESVVVIRRNFTQKGEDLGLVGSTYCHPGFSKSQLWNDHVLKYFEKKVVSKVCRKDVTTAENEIINLRDFFKKGCRPGNWVPDDTLDKKLKKKYHQLCQLCPDQEKCKYTLPENHGHTNALDCLTSGQGSIAYVSLDHVRTYFSPEHPIKNVWDYQFFCENGSRMDLDSDNPCTWYKQPWKVILARETSAEEVVSKLEKTAIVTLAAVPWEKTLNDILFSNDDSPVVYKEPVSPIHHLLQAKGTVELPKSDCGQPIRWCTVNKQELIKCNWTAAAARSLGIQPDISCMMALSPFECFDWIANNDTDIMAVDSNYGLLARKNYGLTALLYCETMEDHYSVVVAVTRDKAVLNKISQWSDIKDKNACFPEFGGIAWLSFINAARDHRILPDSCAYTRVVSKLLKGACTPGFVEADHAQDHKRPSLATDGFANLCNLCPAQTNGERCEANSMNKYYGDKGALDCLKSGDGDIAFVEVRNLNGQYILYGT